MRESFKLFVVLASAIESHARRVRCLTNIPHFTIHNRTRGGLQQCDTTHETKSSFVVLLVVVDTRCVARALRNKSFSEPTSSVTIRQTVGG